LACAARGRVGWAGVALGLGAGCKPILLLLLPGLLVRHRRAAAAMVSTLALVYLPFIGGGTAVFHSLLRFAGTTEFLSLARTAGVMDLTAPWHRAVLLAVLFVFVALIALRVRTWAGAAYASMSVLLLCAPIVHYWYLTWVLALMPLRLRPAWSWIAASAAMVLYFDAERARASGGEWILPASNATVIWLAFGLGAAVDLGWLIVRRRGRSSGTCADS